jgi:uncharacterized protein (DUF697 family)
MAESEIIKKDQEETLLPLFDQEANKILKNYSLLAVGGGVLPNAILSTTVVTGTQIMMLRELCKLYEVPYEEHVVRMIVNAALGSIASRAAAMLVLLVPGISDPMKGLTGGAIAGLYTATVGEFYKVHFQHGGTLENASLNDLSDYIIEEYNRGDINLSKLANPTRTIRDMFR